MQPAGWPHGLVAPDHEDFVQGAVKWLLDQGPAELRISPLRQYPLALALYLESYVRGALEGARVGYSQTRTKLDGVLEASDLELVQQALAAEGARLVAQLRELSLVVKGLRG
jgi:hypothetical protein